MNRAEVEEAVRRILVEDFRIAPTRITGEATLRGTLGLDSMDSVDFLLLLHKEFGFEAKMESYRDLATIADLITFIEKRVNDGKG